MSIQVASQPLPVNPVLPTIAEVCALILADEVMPLRRRSDIASALRRLAKALRVSAEMLIADPVKLRVHLAGLTPVMVGVNPNRWKNIRSLTSSALTHLGICTIPGRFDLTPSTAWMGSLAHLETASEGLGGDGPSQLRFVLGRFARYCTHKGIEPGSVDDGVLSAYRDDLRLRSLVHDHARAARGTSIRWNQVAVAVPAWPQQRLSVANNTNAYALPWDRFPATLKQDVDAWLAHASSDDLSDDGDYFRPLRPASIATRKRQMHGYLSALVVKGEDAAELIDLAAAITKNRAAIGLQFLMDRAGGKSVHAGQVGGMLLSVARHWIKAPPELVKRLKNMTKKVVSPHTGMTVRNQTRLRAVEEPGRLTALLTLPVSLYEEVRREPPCLPLARRMQIAVAMEILIKSTMRMKNLAELKIGVHLLPERNGDFVLVLSEDEVKNGMPSEVRLRGTSARLVQRYLKHDRPLLAQPGSPWLFPGQTADRPKSQDGLRTPLQRHIADRCGLKFHPHLFRHLAGLLILTENPGAHGQVQRQLGHKSNKTVMSTYTGMEGKAAFAHYDQLTERLRGDHPATHPKKGEK